MRNPLTKVAQTNVSKGADTDNRVEPIIERYAGQNIPYRGTQQHGVESDITYPAMPDYTDENEVYADYPTEIEPVPVVIVEQGSPTTARRAFRATNVSVPPRVTANDPGVTNLLGRSESRIAVTIIVNRHDEMMIEPSMFLTHSPDGSPDMGTAYPIFHQTPITLHTDEPIYFVSREISNVDVYMLIEYMAP